LLGIFTEARSLKKYEMKEMNLALKMVGTLTAKAWRKR
jgi:hypothetical protein